MKDLKKYFILYIFWGSKISQNITNMWIYSYLAHIFWGSMMLQYQNMNQVLWILSNTFLITPGKQSEAMLCQVGTLLTKFYRQVTLEIDLLNSLNHAGPHSFWGHFLFVLLINNIFSLEVRWTLWCMHDWINLKTLSLNLNPNYPGYFQNNLSGGGV